MEEFTNSQNRCVSSARAVLEIHKTLHKVPEYRPFQWYNRGIGSFHAFHGAIILLVVLAQTEITVERFETRQMLESSTQVFEEMSHRSAICAKAATILRSFL